jgi:hypothetical protein
MPRLSRERAFAMVPEESRHKRRRASALSSHSRGRLRHEQTLQPPIAQVTAMRAAPAINDRRHPSGDSMDEHCKIVLARRENQPVDEGGGRRGRED